MTAEEVRECIDRSLDTDPLTLRDALLALVTKLEALDGRSADTDAMLDEIWAELESRLP